MIQITNIIAILIAWSTNGTMIVENAIKIVGPAMVLMNIIACHVMIKILICTGQGIDASRNAETVSIWPITNVMMGT